MSNIPPKPKREDFPRDGYQGINLTRAERDYWQKVAERAIEALKLVQETEQLWDAHLVAGQALADITATESTKGKISNCTVDNSLRVGITIGGGET